MQHDGAGEDGEDGLKAHEERDERRVRALLGDDLQRIRHAAREDARIEDGPDDRGEVGERNVREEQHQDAGLDRHDSELNAGELDTVDQQRVPVDGHDLERERQRAQDEQEVSAGDGELAGFDGQKVQSDDGDEHADPHAGRHPFFEEDAEHRDQDDVERRDEAALPRAAQRDARLLQVRRDGQHGAADESADEECLPPVFFLCRRQFDVSAFFQGVLFAPGAHAPGDEKQEDGCYDASRHVERERVQGLRALYLRHERGAPDECRDDRQYRMAEKVHDRRGPLPSLVILSYYNERTEPVQAFFAIQSSV